MRNQRGATYAITALLVMAIGALALGACNSDDNSQPTIPPTPTAEEAQQPSNEIKVEGRSASMLIEPSVDNVISGVVTITVTEPPSDTIMVFFAMVGQGTADTEMTGPNLGIDDDGSDGWSRLFDTTEYDNGLYEISGLPMSDPDSDPLGIVSAQVVIDN
jgi:hypothetical protein